MGITNEGSQVLVYDFRYPAKGRDFNKVSRDVVRPGVYKGLNISYSGNDVFISAGKCYINCLYNGIDNLGIKIDFQSLFTYGTVLPSEFGANEILYLEYEYGQVDENYAEFKRQSINTWLASPNANAVIIGELTFDGSNNITGVDYSRKTWGSINADADWTIPDRLVYHDTDTPAKRWRLDGGLLPTGTRDLQFQNFSQDSARIPVTNGSNTTQIENNINVANDATVVNRLTVGKFDGRVPLGAAIPIVGTRSQAANAGSPNSVASSIPATGAISDDGFQLCDGVAVGSGAVLTGFVPDLTNNRYITGASTNGNMSTGSGPNNGDNTVTLTTNEMPQHSHGVSDPGHVHEFTFGADFQYLDTTPQTGMINFGFDASRNTESATTGITINNSGSGASFNIEPKYVKAIYLMRVR